MTALTTAPERSVRALLARRQPVDLVWLSLGCTALAEMAAQSLPAAVVLDLQHGQWERASLEAAVGLVRPVTQILARVAENRPHAISQVLDAGAHGVIVPLVETAEQAAFAVSCSRYPPLGKRSSGGTRPLLYGMDPARTNEEIVVGVMIETMAGVAHAEAIAATPGVDFVFIGPGDLRLSKGAASPDGIREECEHVKSVCARLGMPCGIFTLNAESALAQFNAGFALAVTASDFGVFARGLKEASGVAAACKGIAA
jgi:2-keto-3-deoxy-L-rhamnonate aldolase RhmA